MLDCQKLLTQRRSHPAPRLFATDHAPMIATCFIEASASTSYLDSWPPRSRLAPQTSSAGSIRSTLRAHVVSRAGARMAEGTCLAHVYRHRIAPEDGLWSAQANYRRYRTESRARIAELQKRKADIDAEITKIKDGHLKLMEPTQVRERFLQMEPTHENFCPNAAPSTEFPHAGSHSARADYNLERRRKRIAVANLR
jgi:hypothetical protein